ncbi:uncharacterized protein LOC128244401 [Mya arenaria]|uniref:uncharacterized protein LOC128244401 n=1 Tax=Mya arenaria TaxID=6604 RepID=UPI0022E41548|nr:uncharacterized protein LOC128244401 [Mya arenaria]
MSLTSFQAKSKIERMCIHPTGEDSKNLSQVHPRRICEELEMSDHLLDILQKGKLVPPDITSKLQVKVNRRDKIHELLRHYDIRKDNGFGTLSSYIKTVRESRGKKAYPLKLFEGNFVAKFDGSSFRLVHTGLSVTWSSSSVAGKSEKHNTSSDSPNSPCTQLFDSTQTTNMDDPSMTKVTEQDKAQKVKVKDLLEKLKAKKQLKEERRDDDYTSLNPNPGPSTETNIYNRHVTKAQRDLANVEKHVNRCRTMISDVKGLFDGHPALSLPREQAWRQELADVEKGLTFPRTVIAVVGNTGEGKSSLMNAVLDHGNVLPTSGLRACTAVVVEVDQNTTSNSFEADIELLQSKEWFDELQILLKELQDDTNKKNDASASYCKVKAVYGRIGSFEILSEITDVTNMLGSIIHIQENDPEEFRLQIEKYIANLDSRTGGQYWPIVKHVRLRMPHCDVCSSGTTLVDLPGVRDSNAARDKIAKNYLKNCTAVWVVSSIHRAIDDKTAKDLLGENFRRQLLMDGQYGSIAFICTKTDVITPSEIIRSLNLNEKTKEYEENVKNMENMKTAVVKEIANVNNVLNEELEIIQEYKEELKTKDALIRENEDRDTNCFSSKRRPKTSLEKTISQERNKIVAICALARNDYSSSHIKRDFKDGLRVG